MRVLFLSNVFPNPLEPHKGVFNRSMLHWLAGLHEVRAVSHVAWTDEVRAHICGRERLDHERPYSVGGVEAEYPRFYFPPKVSRRHYHRYLWWSIGRRLAKTATRFRPDVLLSYWAHPDGAVANRLARQLGVPSVVMVGGSDVLVLAKERVRRKCVYDALHNADAVIAVSRHIASEMIHQGIDAAKIHVVYRGIDRSGFSPGDRADARRRLGLDPSGKLIVSAGRLVPVKGWPVLIDACRRLAQKPEPFACYVLGAGPQQASLSRQVAQVGLERVVRFCGSKQQAELADWYRAADVMVLPSYSEGIPNVLLESMACGCRFVASDVGGIPEIYDPKHDALVPAGNARALADAIEQTWHRPDGPSGRRFEPLSWEDSATALGDVLQSVTSSGESSSTSERPPVEAREQQLQESTLAGSPPTHGLTT